MKREKIITYIYAAALAAGSFAGYIWLNRLSDSAVKPLLDFYKNVVEIFFSNDHYFDEELFCYWGNNYAIGRECLGLSIIALIFCVCGLAGIDRLRGPKRLAWIALCSVMAVVVGVFANILRLLSSIYFTVFVSFELIHALLGIVIYLSSLVFCYTLSVKRLKNSAGSEDIEEPVPSDL